MLIPANSLVIFMFLARIFEGVQDIGIGLVVNRIRRPEGQCRPFFKWFAVPFFLASVLLFLNPPLGENGKLIYGFIVYIAALFMISFLQLPYSAQVSLLTKDSREITTLSSMRFISSSAFSILVGAVFVPLPKGEKLSVFRQLKYLKNLPWFVGLIVTLFMALSYAFNSSMAIYYFTYVMPNKAFAGMAIVVVYLFTIPGSILAPLLGEWLGKKRAILLGIGVCICGKVIMLLGKPLFLFTGIAMTGFGLGLGITIMTALVPDIVDYGEWKHHASTPGILYSAVSLGSKAGSGLAVYIALLILSLGGYNAALEAAQPESAILAIKSAYILIPMLCEIIAFAAMCFYRIERMRDQIQEELRIRHQQEG